MIALNQTRTGLLAEIGAADPTRRPLTNLTDPRVANEEVSVRISGNARNELFSLLKLALTERFAAVARRELISDLLVPLRNALGNAFKHGNGNDPLKVVSVELVLTRKGALIAVTDEGAGFDVGITFRRLQAGEGFFANRGAGFRNLHRAASTVCYENSGRTVLLCFRPTPGGENGASLSTADSVSAPEIPDGRWVQEQLAAEVPEFGGDRTEIQSCRCYAVRGRAYDNCGPRYVVQLADGDGQPVGTQVLTGRLHDSESAAAADFESATRLHAAAELKGLRIPRPVVRFAAAPRLVLFAFDPWMNLREYLTHRSSPDMLRHCAERVGRALARFHRSGIEFCNHTKERINVACSAGFARLERSIVNPADRLELQAQLHSIMGRGWKRDSSHEPSSLAPVHGELNWDCIHYGSDGRFYLYRFETCQRSDPGLDLGGFAADLLGFTCVHHDRTTYRICLDAFLASYNSRADRTMNEEQLRSYILLALSKRPNWMARQAMSNGGELRGDWDAAWHVEACDATGAATS